MKQSILFILSSISIIFADMNISGDMRIRPRIDSIEDGELKESDLYHMYRGRLNIETTIGQGYFLNMKIGTNSISGMSKMADADHYDQNQSTQEPKTSGPGIYNSYRPELSFMELYYGIKKESFGLWGGAFPLKQNPALDIHYYSNKMVDIPWALLNNGTVTGFGGYISNKLDWFFSVDKNNKNSEDLGGSKTELKDSYTLGLSSTLLDFNFAKFNFKIIPRFLYSLTDETENAPLTLGADCKLPTLLSIKTILSFYTTANKNENVDTETSKYSANHLRIKLNRDFGPGNLQFFYDIASYTPDGGSKMNINYLWLSYGYKLYKSDLGSVTLKPTIRIQNGNNIDQNYKRTKLELTTEIKFN